MHNASLCTLNHCWTDCVHIVSSGHSRHGHGRRSRLPWSPRSRVGVGAQARSQGDHASFAVGFHGCASSPLAAASRLWHLGSAASSQPIVVFGFRSARLAMAREPSSHFSPSPLSGRQQWPCQLHGHCHLLLPVCESTHPHHGTALSWPPRGLAVMAAKVRGAGGSGCDNNILRMAASGDDFLRFDGDQPGRGPNYLPVTPPIYQKTRRRRRVRNAPADERRKPRWGQRQALHHLQPKCRVGIDPTRNPLKSPCREARDEAAANTAQD